MTLRRALLFFLSVTISLPVISQYWGKKEYIASVSETGWFAYNPMTRFTLSDEVKETSGLILWDGLLWTHNDSGGEPVLYGMDTLTGEILRTVTLNGASNRDWEDITQDRDYIYVGDFGNNKGNRTDLVIYKMAKESIPGGEQVSTNAEKIMFAFADQDDFDHAFQRHDFDCESIFSIGDSLYLLSKSWITQESRIYALPKSPGDHHAEVKGVFDVDGLATGAAMDETGTRLAVIGYRDFLPFLWLITGMDNADISRADFLRIEFPFLSGAQTEGIEFMDTTSIVFSCEESGMEPQVFWLPVPEGGKMLGSSAEIPEYFDNWEVILYEKKKKNEREIVVDITGLKNYTFSIYFQDPENKVIQLPDHYFDKKMGKLYMRFDARHLPEGKYDVVLRSGYGEWLKNVVIR